MVEHSPGLRPAHSYRLYVRLLGYVRPYWRQFAASLLGMVVVAATEPAIPALFKPLLDQNFVGRDPGGGGRHPGRSPPSLLALRRTAHHPAPGQRRHPVSG